MSLTTVAYVPNYGEYDKGSNVGNPYDIEAIISTWLGSPIEQVPTDEQHLCCSIIEALHTIIWKSRMKNLKIPFEEESMDH